MTRVLATESYKGVLRNIYIFHVTTPFDAEFCPAVKTIEYTGLEDIPEDIPEDNAE